MAAKNIKLNPDETLAHVNKIAETMDEAAVPGPVPPPSVPTSPIDGAFNACSLPKRRGQPRLSIAKTPSAFSFNSLGKPNITC